MKTRKQRWLRTSVLTGFGAGLGGAIALTIGVPISGIFICCIIDAVMCGIGSAR